MLFFGNQVIKTHQIERTLRIAKELSDLIVYCQPVSYDTEKGKLTFLLWILLFYVNVLLWQSVKLSFESFDDCWILYAVMFA